MRKYLLDTNIIIKLWDENAKEIGKAMESNKIAVLKEVLDELAVKETKVYRRQEVLSERFCKLLPYSIIVEKENISGFYMIFDYETKDKFDNHNLSQNDLLQLYACYINNELNLVTEDKTLFNIGKYMLGKNRVLSLVEIKEIL